MIRSALTAADQAVSLAPKNSSNYLILGQIYEGMLATMDKADEKAIENYQKALELDPRNPAIYQQIASVYITMSDIENLKNQQQKENKSAELSDKSKEYLVKAEGALKKALEIKKDYAKANLTLASLYERQGNLDKAIEKEKENRQTFPKDPSIALRLGMFYYKAENWDEAEKAFRDAIRLNSKYSDAYYFLGLTLDKKNQKDEAEEQFKRVAELNPDNEKVKKIIDNLEKGRDALEGLQEQVQVSPTEGESQGETNGQPEINPQVEKQEIPKEAVPQEENSSTTPKESSAGQKQ
jgi:tetratricopeptide (TPR) repeat protein